VPLSTIGAPLSRVASGYLLSCPRCGQLSPQRHKYCGVCGTALSALATAGSGTTSRLTASSQASARRLRACPHCKELNTDDRAFCAFCGKKIGDDQPAAPSARAAQTTTHIAAPQRSARRRSPSGALVWVSAPSVLGVLIAMVVWRPSLLPAAVLQQVQRVAPAFGISADARKQAEHHLASAVVAGNRGDLEKALEETTAALVHWPGHPQSNDLVTSLSPRATATASARAAVAAAEATRVARIPTITVLSQRVTQTGNRVHVLGEVRNDSPHVAFWQVLATFHAADGAVVAQGSFEPDRVFNSGNTWRWPAPPLAGGDIQPYWVTVTNAPPFTDVRLSTKGHNYENVYSRLAAPPIQLPSTLTASGGRVAVRGSVTNNTSAPQEAYVLVWFLNAAGQVVEAHDQKVLQPAPLFPNVSAPVEAVASGSDVVSAKWVVWGTPPPPPRQ
jgi:RNA polymerase subunit RPABC4/transcription elongation factor Spt4